MPIRDVGNRATTSNGDSTQIPQQAERTLRDSGLAKSPQDAQKVAGQIVSKMRDGGVPVPAHAELGAQLRSGLATLQKGAGLPASGDLDKPTLGLLALHNMLPKNPSATSASVGSPTPKKNLEKDGFERVSAQASRLPSPRAEPPPTPHADPEFVDGLLSLLNGSGLAGSRHGSPLDLAGLAGNRGRPADNDIGAAVLQAIEKTKAAEDSAHVVKASTRENEAPTPAGADMAKAQSFKVSRGLQSDSPPTADQRRRETLGVADPTELGILDEEADDGTLYGDGGDGRRRRGGGGDAEAGGDDADASAVGAEGHRPEDGTEREVGNATSGHVDPQSRARGHASIDDDSGAGPGHYEVPLLSVQAFAALPLLKCDPQVDNRTTTYSWDVTFHRPGVYGAGQKAEALFHLVVKNASAFDPVWHKAQANLAALVSRVQSDAQILTLDDLLAAMRQARFRGGESMASQMVRARPIGRP